MKFNELLQRAAESRGLTQAEIARRSGLSTGLIARYWKGDHVPSVDRLGRLAAAIGCDPGELVPMPDDDEDQAEPVACSA